MKTRHRIGLATTLWGARDLGEDPIRIYDEPETSLHYSAQQSLINLILSSEGQRIVSTHSPLFIDRFPMKSIRVLDGSDSESRTITSWEDVGNAVGIPNSSLLFEHRFVLLEGPTEVNFFREVYSSMLARTLEEDGVVLINLETCGAWKSVCRALFTNRLQSVRILLDRDCLNPESTAQVTKDRIVGTGLFGNDEDANRFLESQVAFIGKKEFEDFFPSRDWAQAINEAFSLNLSSDDVDGWKRDDKFSDKLHGWYQNSGHICNDDFRPSFPELT